MSLTDRMALLALFRSTDGTRWTRNDQWGTAAPLSHWYGVNVSHQGRVVMISLHNNNLRGPIPKALRVLSKLKTLRLYNNLISGHIPPELGDLAVLEELNLSWNQLGGEIPTTLGKLGNLKWLSLGDNKLRGTIPKELAALKKVEAFWINDNRLTGLGGPDWGENLGLWRARLHQQQRNSCDTDGQDAFARRRSRRHEKRLMAATRASTSGHSHSSEKASSTLVLSTSAPSTLAPSALATSARDSSVRPPSAPISTLATCALNPSTVGTLALVSSTGHLSALSPATIAPATPATPATPAPSTLAPFALARADRNVLLAFFHSTGGPLWRRKDGWETDADLSLWDGVTVNGDGRVVELCLVANNLRGKIPKELGKLTALAHLDLRQNGLIGEVPASLGHLGNLQLHLSGNRLSGPVLGETLLSSRERLQEVTTAEDGRGSNGLTDASTQIGGFARVTEMARATRQTLDETIDLCRQRLQQPRTSENEGPDAAIPGERAKFGGLSWIANLTRGVSETKASPTTTSADRAALLALFRSTGGPAWWGKQNWGTDAELSRWYGVEVNDEGRVVKICLNFNNLRGQIPKELGSLSALKGLWLYNNHLSGRIPPELGQLGVLQQLDLASNNLSGSIPEELGSLTDLRLLLLENNPLSGTDAQADWSPRHSP